MRKVVVLTWVTVGLGLTAFSLWGALFIVHYFDWTLSSFALIGVFFTIIVPAFYWAFGKLALENASSSCDNDVTVNPKKVDGGE